MPRRRASRPVVERVADGFVLNLPGDERELVVRLLGQLRDLLLVDDPDTAPLVRRLFPPAYVGDEFAEQEAEYRRFMREELVASRLSAIESVSAVLRARDPFPEETALALLQSLNNLRLVLGTMLDVGEEHDPTEVADNDPRVGEHHLYAFLSWLVNAFVEAISGIE